MRKRFPHYHQLDAMDCGACCLRMIAKYYGKSYSGNLLQELCLVGHEGVSVLSISDAAEKLGFRTVCGKVSYRNFLNKGSI